MSYKKPRNANLNIRVNKEDLAGWDAVAKVQGMKRNGWLIQVLNHAAKTQVIYHQLRQQRRKKNPWNLVMRGDYPPATRNGM